VNRLLGSWPINTPTSRVGARSEIHMYAGCWLVTYLKRLDDFVQNSSSFEGPKSVMYQISDPTSQKGISFDPKEGKLRCNFIRQVNWCLINNDPRHGGTSQ